MKNRTILKYHSWLGLIVGVFLLIMGISGSILVFQHDIEDVLWQRHKEITNYESLEIDKAFSVIQDKYPDWDTRLIHFEENKAFIFNLRKPTQRLFIFVHPGTGEILNERNELTTVTRWLLKFHYSFQAGVPGRILVLVIGILFFLSLLTGIYLYRRSILKTLLFKANVRNKNKRAFYSSLHRIIGVWALLLNLVLVVTGIFLSYKVTTASLKTPVNPEPPIVTTSVELLLKNIKSQAPNFKPTTIRLPSGPDGSITVNGIYNNDAFFYSEFYNSFKADHKTGVITEVIKVQESDLTTKLSSTLIPLHFGQFGGIWSKILYSFIGLSGPFLSVSGFIIWQKGKNSKKKRFK